MIIICTTNKGYEYDAFAELWSILYYEGKLETVFLGKENGAILCEVRDTSGGDVVEVLEKEIREKPWRRRFLQGVYPIEFVTTLDRMEKALRGKNICVKKWKIKRSKERCKIFKVLRKYIKINEESKEILYVIRFGGKIYFSIKGI